MSDKLLLMDIFLSIESSIDMVLERTMNINTPEGFIASKEGVMMIDSISMRLQFIGESLKKIEKHNKDFLYSYHEIEWQKIINFRDFISHHYDMLNHQIIFDICKNHIPKLKIVIAQIITDLKNATS